jgi:DNA polymerase III sliding clamp (beta) subunit (PCNA family)
MFCNFSCPQNVLVSLVNSTIRATDNESTRYALSHIRIHVTEDKVQAVACDGRVLAVREIPHKGDIKTDGAEFFYLPEEVAKEIAYLQPSITKMVTVSFMSQSSEFRIEDSHVKLVGYRGRRGEKEETIEGRTKYGRFPSFEQCFPRGKIVGTMKGDVGSILAQFEPDTLVAFVDGVRVMEPIDRPPVDVEGNFSFVLDPAYVSNLLGWTSKTEVVIECRGETSPVVFRMADYGFTALIMPCGRK